MVRRKLDISKKWSRIVDQNHLHPYLISVLRPLFQDWLDQPIILFHFSFFSFTTKTQFTFISIY
jgi:hypothetical protein